MLLDEHVQLQLFGQSAISQQQIVNKIIKDLFNELDNNRKSADSNKNTLS